VSEQTHGWIESAASVTSPLDQQILRRPVLVRSSRADCYRLARQNEAARAADASACKMQAFETVV
jgi:hypothetical protein